MMDPLLLTRHQSLHQLRLMAAHPHRGDEVEAARAACAPGDIWHGVGQGHGDRQ